MARTLTSVNAKPIVAADDAHAGMDWARSPRPAC